MKKKEDTDKIIHDRPEEEEEAEKSEKPKSGLKPGSPPAKTGTPAGS